MAKGCKKCDPHEICEECPEWIFTLADLIMCMMGLFVILWVMKPGTTNPPPPDTKAAQEQTDDYLATIGELRGGMGFVPDPSHPDQVDQAMARKRQRDESKEKGDGGDATQKRDTPVGSDDQSTTVRQGKQSAVGGRLLFDAGATRFTPETMHNLSQIAETIRGHRTIVMVKGHTSLDDLPEDASAEERMDLSLRRAQSVADYLTSQGVSPEILRVQGCSTFEPVKQRAYASDALQMNRRVEVLSTPDLIDSLQDPDSTVAPKQVPHAEDAPPTRSEGEK